MQLLQVLQSASQNCQLRFLNLILFAQAAKGWQSTSFTFFKLFYLFFFSQEHKCTWLKLFYHTLAGEGAAAILAALRFPSRADRVHRCISQQLTGPGADTHFPTCSLRTKAPAALNAILQLYAGVARCVEDRWQCCAAPPS